MATTMNDDGNDEECIHPDVVKPERDAMDAARDRVTAEARAGRRPSVALVVAFYEAARTYCDALEAHGAPFFVRVLSTAVMKQASAVVAIRRGDDSRAMVSQKAFLMEAITEASRGRVLAADVEGGLVELSVLDDDGKRRSLLFAKTAEEALREACNREDMLATIMAAMVAAERHAVRIARAPS